MYTKIILIRSIKINERYRNKREYTISDRHVLATLSLSHRESKGDRGTLDIQSHGSLDRPVLHGLCGILYIGGALR